MEEKYIIVQLTDYLSQNEGKIAKDKEVVFNYYESRYVRSSGFGGMSMATTFWGETVTHVRKWKEGYRGTTAKGKRIDCEERNATIHMPLSILKELTS